MLDRVAPIHQVLDAASASDLEIADLWSRPGPTADQAADISLGLLSPELYRLRGKDSRSRAGQSATDSGSADASGARHEGP